MNRHLPRISFQGAYLLALLLFSPALHAAPVNKPGGGGPPVGGLAPAFALPDLSGRPLALDSLRGRPVVLNFWAFWCDTWKAELPSLRALAEQQDEMGFRLVAVSVDGTRLAEFQRLTGGQVPFPVLLDAGGAVSRRYAVRHVPTVVILDGAGRVRFVASGYPGNAVVLRELRKIGG